MFTFSSSHFLRTLVPIRAAVMKAPIQAKLVNRLIISNKAISIRHYSEEALMDEYEQKIYNILKEKFDPKDLEVKDVSGGCGSMFAIKVESEQFKGISMIKQHRLVNEILADEISKWHGLQLRTKAA